ncbi:MAG: hypothetical protein SFW62_08570 [Alphaproteobacteria bacterium]|nr:hypothetical protein [Alphaproteobacteria bacterium]
MEPFNAKPPQNNTSMWITSLAISVTCCAILFVVFAGYLTDIKQNIATGNARLEQMAAHQDALLLEIQSLHRSLTTQGAATNAAPVATAPSPAVTPEAPVVPAANPLAPTPAVPADAAPAVPVVTPPAMPAAPAAPATEPAKN